MEQPVLRGLEQHRPLTDEELLHRVTLATQMRVEIAGNMTHSTGSIKTELKGEYGKAYRHERRLLGAVAARGLLGDFLEADWQNRGVKKNDNEEEMVWQAS